MKICAVVASIRLLDNLKPFAESLGENLCNLYIIDEGDESIREKNRQTLSAIPHSYFGPRERVDWFKNRFGASFEKYSSVIPQKCHAETSFGFLLAFDEKPDFVIELDDDVLQVAGEDLLLHQDNLTSNDGYTVTSPDRWYNTLDDMVMNTQNSIFPRGHPYATETRNQNYVWSEGGAPCVLNMGLWTGQTDLDAVTILYHGGLDGRCNILGEQLRRKKVVIGKETYFAVCSMNCAFIPKIIPAFYQLYMNYLGVDRFDDIWSGILVKKVADHLGDGISLGQPLVYHDKQPRDTFKNLRAELEGIAWNETFWRIVDSAELNGKDYAECYEELADAIDREMSLSSQKSHREFMARQVEKMRLWLRIVDEIG